MFFRNLTLFRLPASASKTVNTLQEKLSERALRPCGPLEMQSRGWISPFGRDNEAMVHSVGKCHLLTLGIEDKILPGAVVNKVLAEKLAVLEEERGKPVGGKERRRIKDEVLTDLMPRAFARPARISAYMDLEAGWLLLDTASKKAAENFLSVLRETIGSFAALPADGEESPRVLMTSWLAEASLPPGFELGDECELKDPVDRGAIMRCRRQELSADEVLEHLRCGKQVTQLSVVIDERVGVVIGEDLTLRKLRFMDSVTDELEHADNQDYRAELDARFALMSLTLRPVLEKLESIFKLAASK